MNCHLKCQIAFSVLHVVITDADELHTLLPVLQLVCCAAVLPLVAAVAVHL